MRDDKEREDEDDEERGRGTTVRTSFLWGLGETRGLRRRNQRKWNDEGSMRRWIARKRKGEEEETKAACGGGGREGKEEGGGRGGCK